MRQEPQQETLHSGQCIPRNPRTSSHFTAPSLSLKSRDLAGGAETEVGLGGCVAGDAVCQKAEEERKESWDGQG